MHRKQACWQNLPRVEGQKHHSFRSHVQYRHAREGGAILVCQTFRSPVVPAQRTASPPVTIVILDKRDGEQNAAVQRPVNWFQSASIAATARTRPDSYARSGSIANPSLQFIRTASFRGVDAMLNPQSSGAAFITAKYENGTSRRTVHPMC